MAKKNMLTSDDITALLCAWLIDGATQAEIGELLGVSGPAVGYHIRKRGLTKLQGAGEAVAHRIVGVEAVRRWQPTAWQTSPQSPRQARTRAIPQNRSMAWTPDDLIAIAALGAAFALGFTKTP